MDYNFTPKNAVLRHCKKCDFACSKNSDWNRHILTAKHQKDDVWITMDYNFTPKNANALSVCVYSCECGKQYKYRQGLYKHKKMCKNMNNVKEVNENKDSLDKDLIMMLIKENKETRDALIEMSNKIQPNNIVTNNNSHNKTFNLNFFLNEQCKDALNISDFVSSIKLDINDLENTGKVGYVEGITKIIVNNLRSLDIFKRPIHCSDIKREILYIKDENKWEKESEEKDKLTKAIKVIANENIKQINKWKKKNPQCKDPESMKNNEYLKIVSNAMSGSTEDETNKNINKIISNVAKEVLIEK